MGIIAEALRHMLAAGMNAEAVVLAVEDMERAALPKVSSRTERNRRYYENKRLKTTESILIKTEASDTSELSTPPLDRFPDLPLTPPIKTPKGVKKPPKLTIQAWEERNGELKPEAFGEFAKKQGWTQTLLAENLRTFREKCVLKNYDYTDFRRAFQSWDWNKNFSQAPPKTVPPKADTYIPRLPEEINNSEAYYERIDKLKRENRL